MKSKNEIKSVLDRQLSLSALTEYVVALYFCAFVIYPGANTLRRVCFGGDLLWATWRNWIFRAAAVFLLLMLLWRFDRTQKGAFPFPLKKLREHPAICFLLALAVWAVVSTGVTGFLRESVIGSEKSRTGLICTLCYFTVFFMALLMKDEKLIRLWLGIFLGVAGALCLFILWDYFLNGCALNPTQRYRIFYHGNHFSYYMLMVTVCAQCLFLLSENRRVYAASLSLYLCAVPSLIIGDALGCLVAFGCSLVFLPIVLGLAGRFRWKRYVLTVVLAAAVLLAMVSMPNTAEGSVAEDAFEANISTLIESADALSDLENAAGSLGSGRMRLWQRAFRCMKEKPLFGYGLAAMRGQLIEASGNRDNTVHNEFLEYATNHGIPALLFYLAFILSIYLRGLKHRRELTELQLLGLCTAFAYLCSSFFGVTIFYTAPYLFIFLAFGYWRETPAEKKSGKKKKKA